MQNHSSHVQPHKKISSFNYLATVFVALLIVGSLYYFGGFYTRPNNNSVYVTPDVNIIEGILDATEADRSTVQKISGTNVQTTHYVVLDRNKNEIITDILQFLTQKGWAIVSGTELDGGKTYMISAFEQSKNQNLQVNITEQGSGYSVSLIYPEA